MKTTPLNAWHHQSGARMVDFSGWEMPIQYDGIIAEHQRTRTQAGLFDVSHMGELHLEGPDALANLQRLLPNDFRDLQIGQVRYSPLLYDNGTCVDDLSVYKLCDEKYLLCVNASNIDKDREWIQSHLQGDVTLTDKSAETGQIAIQGPAALSIVEKLVGRDLSAIKYWWFDWALVEGKELMLARMGYTGEDGFEIFCKAGDTQWVWDQLLILGKDQGIGPVGLGARDTLRLEVTFPLYGQELNETHPALAAGLGSFIKLDKAEDFIGKAALVQAKQNGMSERLVKFVLEGKGVPRPHYRVLDLETGEPIGEVTSGTHSPMTSQGIGMAYVKTSYAEVDRQIGIEVRNRVIAAKIIKGAFVKVARKG
ncbi:MAG: glycine cleavage system aminomethyltransferase GcvT [bacterium]|nr:glycine cleavage system aminomethyltransferase GcvT [bacterium]